MTDIRIPHYKVFEIVPDADKRVHSGVAINAIRKRHCAKIKIAGYCDMQCETTCGTTLKKGFRKLNTSRDVKKPAALLIWLLRANAANLIEELREKDKHEPVRTKDNWGNEKNPAEESSFGVLEELYD